MRLIKPMNNPESKGNGAKNFYVEIFSSENDGYRIINSYPLSVRRPAPHNARARRHALNPLPSAPALPSR